MSGNKKPSDIFSTLPLHLRKVAEIFHRNQYQCWVVGGAIRDSLLNKTVQDYDLATDASPEQVMKLFPRCLPTGIKHGTVTILFRGRHFETTTFRLDGKYSDGRHPDRVHYANNILDDLSRRDFSMNSMALNAVTGEFMDPHGGQKDMDSCLIRAIGSPEERFREDSLRTIRACRFASQLEFTLEEKTFRAISTVLPRISQLAAERIWQEMTKILSSRKPSIAFHLFLETGLLKEIIPEMESCHHTSFHGERLTDILFRRCDLLSLPRLRLANLLRNIARTPPWAGNGRENAEAARKVLKRLKVPAPKRHYILAIIANQFRDTSTEWPDAQLRHFLSELGPEHAKALLRLWIADAQSIGDEEQICRLRSLEKRAHEQFSQPLGLADLAVSGGDLMTTLNLGTGKVIGRLLNELLAYVLDDPGLNQRAYLLEKAREIIEADGTEEG